MTLDRIEGLNNGGIVNLIVKLWLAGSFPLSLARSIFHTMRPIYLQCVASKIENHFVLLRSHCECSHKIGKETEKNGNARDNIVTYTEFTPELP